MTEEKPYECDTSRYYQPYKDNNKCICNKNLVEINGFCLCDARLGFKLHQENDNCECTKQGAHQYVSSRGRFCVLCDELNGQVKNADGACVCNYNFKMVQNNPLQCFKCNYNQYLKDNKCFCSSTHKEGTCQLKQFSVVQISFIVFGICLLILVAVLIEHQIQLFKRRKQAQKKYDQNAVQIVPIRRSQLIV
ncbi:Hypothetical_protein [Hexamita inflata]|uniref:Hypothetical_protein n=1 Tax=Hexamita inflata TaxID=28002 RepID=A0AA86U540_9EUKA|nr:Hypothetical protein HINF_LOCUS18438 [Hexamita inflata]